MPVTKPMAQPSVKPRSVSTEVTQMWGQRKPTVRPSQSTTPTADGAGKINADTPVMRTIPSQKIISMIRNKRESRCVRFTLILSTESSTLCVTSDRWNCISANIVVRDAAVLAKIHLLKRQCARYSSQLLYLQDTPPHQCREWQIKLWSGGARQVEEARPVILLLLSQNIVFTG